MVVVVMMFMVGFPVGAAEIKGRTQTEQKKIDETRKRIQEKKTELNGSRWEVVVDSSTDPKKKGEKDTFVFQDDQFTSNNMSKRGYASTNYTVSVPSEESDSGVWETMKTGKDGVIFVRGEWMKEKMQGSVTEQLDGGKKVKEYTFSTTSREAIPASSSKDESTESGNNVTHLDKTSNDNIGSKVLVSKETVATDTTQASKKDAKKNILTKK
jgi:hypothetical protein